GRQLHECGADEEFMALEVDLDYVRASRRNGILRLGQPLKSFRDKRTVFPIYQPGGMQSSYLDSLGPLEKPKGRVEDENEQGGFILFPLADEQKKPIAPKTLPKSRPHTGSLPFRK